MKEKRTPGTWGVRLLIHLFTVTLGVLIFWLLGFLVKDIKSIKGPDYLEVERGYVDQALVQKKEQLDRQIGDLDREITNKREQQRLVGDSSQNLQRTINQLLELQKLSIQKEVSLSESEKGNLSVSLNQFLETQKSYQELNESISQLTARKLSLGEDNRQIDRQLSDQRVPAQKEFRRLNEAHRLRLGFYQLLILVPLLLVGCYILIRWRSSIYFPMFLAFAGATLVKVSFVVHEYFPSRYFKYVLISALLAVVARLLVYLIRIVAFPKVEWLMRQYREAYERFLCPICEYPIRTGPRKFLYWTRRTVHKILPQGEFVNKEEPYTCPSCGAILFEECAACQKIRHSLLVHCEHCGAKKDVK
jgi:predicted RNA-binding Zn-ribbon protein involved in translation (DUF1610 family)/K+/H+ antiporter YhaU regulatory subunit KhtT